MHSDSTARPSVFVVTLDLKLAEKLLSDLLDQGFEKTIPTPPHTIFSAKKKGVSCTLYQSGKLTVQGKEMAQFIEFYLEPTILGTFSYSHPNAEVEIANQMENVVPHIGIDESGKGDYFGPLCIAGVYADAKGIAGLRSLGVKDSKEINDAGIIKIGNRIKAEFNHHIVKINPLKYNELYQQFGNLNHLLAWGHATTIEQLVLKTQCRTIMIDQFAAEHVVIRALARKKMDVNLTQRHRGEEDIVVAAASILARQTFLEGMDKLSEEFCIRLPKGASAKTKSVAREFVQKMGKDALKHVAKLHFKTTLEIL